MQSEHLTTAEQLAMRLVAGEEDPLVFQSLRYAALAQANDWQAPWLAREFVEVFDKATVGERPHTETAAIVLGMLQATRVGIGEIRKRADERSARTNSAVVAAAITAVGLILAAAINLMGNLSAAKAKPSPLPVAGDGKPNVIQIVVPTPAPPTVVLQADPKPAALGIGSAKPKPAEASPQSKGAAPSASPVPVHSAAPSPAAEAPSQPDSP